MGDSTGLGPIVALGVVNKVKPDVSFTVRVVLAPEKAYERVKAGLLAVCRTRVLTRFPKPISASCYYGDFDGGFTSRHPSLNLVISVTAENGERSRITVHCRSNGNISAETHELRRREVRRLLEWIVDEYDSASPRVG